MERRLIVMRHAKSSWATDAESDHARPLNDRGRSEAPLVARRLLADGWRPEFVLSSDARRTRETWQAMAEVCGDPTPGEFLRALYLAGYSDLLQAATLVPDDVTTLLVLGHNPGWEDVVEVLTGQPTVLKTASAARMSRSGETWHEALTARRTWQLLDVIRGRAED